MAKIKEFEINVTLKNNLLKERRLALGFTQARLAQEAGINLGDYTALEGLRMFPLMNLPICRFPDCDRPTNHRSGYLCWKHADSPGGMDFPLKMGWKKSVLRLIDYFSCQPSDLFPDVILKIDNPSSSMKLDEDQVSRMKQILSDEMREPPRLISAVEEEYMKVEEIRQLESFIGMLNPIQQKVLREHWGLGCKPRTCKQIGKSVKLSHTRISQIEWQAIRILRNIYAKSLRRERLMKDDEKAEGEQHGNE
jgi:DNA-binding XRE family transcriptional regulator